MSFTRSKTLRTGAALLVITTMLAASASAAPRRWGHRNWNHHHNWNHGGWWSWWSGWNNQTGPADTPEIDPALAGGAFTLLLGGVLIVSDSLRKKKVQPQD